MIKIMFFVLFSLSLYGDIGSSIKIPTHEHLKYSFGNHKNHPIQEIEKHQYYKSLAAMSHEAITKKLLVEGYTVNSITLCDINSELIYDVYVKDTMKKILRLYIDPSNGTVLKKEALS